MKHTRIISLILSAAICLAQIPMQAFAAEESSQFTIEASTAEPITVTGQSGEAQAKGDLFNPFLPGRTGDPAGL